MKNRLVVENSLEKLQARCSRIHSAILLFAFMLASNFILGQESILDQKIKLKDQNSSVYEILNQISDQTGYYFIYDSKLVNSDRIVEITSDAKPLNDFLKEIVNDSSLKFKIIEKHILIYQDDHKTELPITNAPVKPDSVKFLTIKGKILDSQTKNPLPFVTVGLIDINLGTITNFDGKFSLKLPASLINTSLVISHLGYKTQNIPIKLLIAQKNEILMEVSYISIQEVIIRNVDSREVIKKVYQNRQTNYSKQPVYFTSFYREGVLKDSKYLNYSEAVVKIYKTSYIKSVESDQVKLFKSRKVINVDQKDTIVLKLKGGLYSCLALDLIKNIPDFIDPQFTDSYNFTKVDIVSINSRNAYAIAFEQKDNIIEPLYKGTLYIDMENYALINAEFEINPKYVKDTDYLFVLKKSRKYRVTPEKINYSVSYNCINGKYYINHIRGDLTINYKKRYHLFSDNFHAFLELATSQIDTLNVQKFSRDEVVKTNTIFVDSKFSFDETYWGDYNIIVPEEKLSQALSRINAKMEYVKPN